MSPTVNCPHCSQAMQYVPELQGQQVLCPHCQRQFQMLPTAQPQVPRAMPVQPAPGQPPQGQPVQGQPVQGQPVQGQAVPPSGVPMGGLPMGGLPMGAAVTAVGGPGRSAERRLTGEQMRSLKTPAMLMLIVNVIGMLLATAGFVFAGYSLATGPTALDLHRFGENWQTIYVIRLLICVVNMVLMWLVITGAQKMGQGRDYGAAKTAAVISCIPCCGMSIFAMPFGIWSLVVLSDPEIRRNFRSLRRRR